MTNSLRSNAPLVLALFMAGLVGSAGHCAGMCGPFVLAQVGARTQLNRLAGSALLPYHLGRGTTYIAQPLLYPILDLVKQGVFKEGTRLPTAPFSETTNIEQRIGARVFAHRLAQRSPNQDRQHGVFGQVRAFASDKNDLIYAVFG